MTFFRFQLAFPLSFFISEVSKDMSVPCSVYLFFRSTLEKMYQSFCHFVGHSLVSLAATDIVLFECSLIHKAISWRTNNVRERFLKFPKGLFPSTLSGGGRGGVRFGGSYTISGFDTTVYVLCVWNLACNSISRIDREK